MATIIDSHRILVMSEGQAVEFDHPYKLLVSSENAEEERENGHFYRMVRDSGEKERLTEIARKNYLI